MGVRFPIAFPPPPPPPLHCISIEDTLGGRCSEFSRSNFQENVVGTPTFDPGSEFLFLCKEKQNTQAAALRNPHFYSTKRQKEEKEAVFVTHRGYYFRCANGIRGV